MKTLIGFFAINLFCFMGLLYTLLNRSYRRFYVPAKMLCSSAFVITAIAMACLSFHTDRLKILLPALIFCFAGDLLLGLHNRRNQNRLLMAGAAMFALGHICFVAYMVNKAGFAASDLIIPFFGVLFAFLLTGNRQFSFGKYKAAACIYAFFVTALASKSVSVFFRTPSLSNALFAAGGVLFLVSDCLIAVLYFKKKRAWAVHGLNLGTYYLGIFLIAASLIF